MGLLTLGLLCRSNQEWGVALLPLHVVIGVRSLIIAIVIDNMPTSHSWIDGKYSMLSVNK